MATAAAKRRPARVYSLPAPTRGLILNEPLSGGKPGGARVLENWFPTATSVRARGGALKYATIGTGPVTRMWTYKSGTAEQFFAADETNVCEITSVADASTAPTPLVTGQTSGYYSTAQFGTAGGDYLYAVNGSNPALLYDATSFYPITSQAIYGLAYDARTVAFNVGATVTGGTSGAAATIIKIVGSGATGTLWVKGISGGPFVDNETLTGSGGGSATSNIPSGVTTVQAVTISGVSTSTLSFVWSFASRLFFVQKDTMLAWYLPVDSIGGTASSFSLAGIFQDGGSLVMGGKWSLDAGNGLDDKCLFISSEGEVAVYQGTDPNDATAWTKVGVYKIAPVKGINAAIQAGGDFLVATKEGIIPISMAVNKDVAALALSAVSAQIEPEWKKKSAERATIPWEMMKWPSKNMLVVSVPATEATQQLVCFVANLQTGAWTFYTGWDARCLCHWSDSGYFGTSDGKVYRMESGGSDDGMPYTCTYVGLPDSLKAPASVKTYNAARATFQSNVTFKPKLSASVNYKINLPTAPNSAAATSGSVWDVGLWDVAMWDYGNTQTVSTKWASIGKTGFIVSPQVQVTFGISLTPNLELLQFDFLYDQGGVMV